MALHNITAIVTDKRGKVLAVAENSYTKTHPLQAELAERVGKPHRIFLHAEVAALLKAKKHGNPYRLVLSRIGKSGEQLPCQPCKVCKEAIEMFGIKEVNFIPPPYTYDN